jgi:hypothetical protein
VQHHRNAVGAELHGELHTVGTGAFGEGEGANPFSGASADQPR